MSTRTFTIAFDVPGAVEIGAQGRLALVKTATAALTIETTGTASTPALLENVGAGTKYRRPDPWRTLKITSASIQTVEIVVSNDDDIDFANAVSVTGAVSVVDTPATTMADKPAVVVATGTQDTLFSANAARKRITVNADSNNPGSCYARTTGGSNNIKELQPGGSYTFVGLYALDVRNDTGGTCTFYIAEES